MGVARRLGLLLDARKVWLLLIPEDALFSSLVGSVHMRSSGTWRYLGSRGLTSCARRPREHCCGRARARGCGGGPGPNERGEMTSGSLVCYRRRRQC